MTKARDIADFKFENITDTGTEGTKVASGTTAQRGSTQGQIRFNSTTGLAEYYTGTAFKSIDAPPTVSSVDVTEVDSQAGGNQTFVITGANFGAGAIITFVGANGTNFNASTTTVNSDTQITAVAPKSSFLNAQEPYGIKCTNVSGLDGTLSNQINVDTSPTWSTASGTIATITDNATGTHATVSATDVDGDTVAYSETGGTVLSGQNLTLNSSTGAISGDPTNVSSSTTLNFTLRATANSKTVDRAFNIILNPTPDGSSSALATANPTALYNATGINTSGVYWIKSSTFNSGTPVQGYFLYDGNDGYLMICNYLHQGGTNPNLDNRTNSSLPLLGSSSLGTNEAGGTYWGHINGGTSGGTGSFGTVNMVRWYAITSGHSRVIHFQNNNTNTINYCNTGSGDNTGLASGMTTLSGHNANIPSSANNFQSGWTDFAFYQSGAYHWGLKGGNRWEVDDYANGSGNNTLHRVWVRYAS